MRSLQKNSTIRSNRYERGFDPFEKIDYQDNSNDQSESETDEPLSEDAGDTLLHSNDYQLVIKQLEMSLRDYEDILVATFDGSIE